MRTIYRSFRQDPVVWTAVVLSLALGTGANIALFSLVNGLMLRPLNVHDPDRLVVLKPVSGIEQAWSFAIFQELKNNRALFARSAAWASQTFNTEPRGRSSLVNGLFVSGGFFETIGVDAARGRPIDEDDDRTNGGAAGPVAVISHAFWQTRYGGREDTIGRTLLLERVAFTIVGITPREFLGPEVGTAFDVAVPLGTEPLVRTPALVNLPGVLWLTIVARLEAGQTIGDATARLRAFQPALERVDRLTDPTSRLLNEPLELVAAGRGVSPLRDRYRRPFVVLGIVAALVLAIACANIANLLLVRAIARQRETSVRVALGATRRALVLDLLRETSVVAAIGTAAGALLAWWGSAALMKQVVVSAGTASLDLSPDWRVFAFALGVATFTLFASTLLPAIRAGRMDAAHALAQAGHRIRGASGYRVAHLLLVVQIAFTLALLVGAGLFIRTLTALLTQPLGVERGKVLVIRVEPTAPPADPDRMLDLFERIHEAARGAPGVERVSLSATTPIGRTLWQVRVEFPDLPGSLAEDDRVATANVVSPDFFATFGTRIIAGREFRATDRRKTPPVAVVNQAFVDKYLAGGTAIGRRVRQVGFGGRPSVDREIVGVVENAAYLSLREKRRPTMYIPIAQRFQPPPVAFVSVRAAAGAPALLADRTIDAISTVTRDLTFTVTTLSDQIDKSIAQERMVAALSGFFGALALLLAGLGLYGVTSHVVSQRQTELGIRLAIGATPGRVIRLVLTRVALLVACGIAIGAGLMFWAAPLVATLLYGLAPRDPLTFALSAAIVALVGIAAGLIPARRAARLDPAAVLRRE
ncbi:MAG TPA: ABC transporter permease [Vicinamibacterales bacterium]|jgi:predicted permease